MITLKQVVEKGIVVQQTVLLFGATAEFLQESELRFQAIGKAICQEKSLFPGAAVSLPEETILGPEAEARYDEWQELLRRSHPDFAQS